MTQDLGTESKHLNNTYLCIQARIRTLPFFNIIGGQYINIINIIVLFFILYFINHIWPSNLISEQCLLRTSLNSNFIYLALDEEMTFDLAKKGRGGSDDDDVKARGRLGGLWEAGNACLDSLHLVFLHFYFGLCVSSSK